MNTRTNFLVSLIAAVIFGGFLFLAGILRFHKPTGSLIAAGIGTGLVFFGCWVALSIAAAMTKKRQAALEAEPDEEC